MEQASREPSYGILPQIRAHALFGLKGLRSRPDVATEAADFVPFFYNHGVTTIILRNRLRKDGYDPKTDAVHDAMQAIPAIPCPTVPA
jgi:hypothetical protein